MAPRHGNRLGVLAGAGALTLATVLSGPSAGAATAPQLTAISFGYGDSVWNYDFTTTSGASWRTVDWAVSLLFYDNATVNKVKAVTKQNFNYWTVGGPMYSYQDDGSGGSYDSDRGVKTDTPSCFGSTRHSRIYAPSSTDRMYNPTFGYYVFATTHIDHHELCNDWYDGSESTEKDIGNLFRGKGYQVDFDYGYLYNTEQNRVEGDHHWDNNGYATYIRVP